MGLQAYVDAMAALQAALVVHHAALAATTQAVPALAVPEVPKGTYTALPSRRPGLSPHSRRHGRCLRS